MGCNHSIPCTFYRTVYTWKRGTVVFNPMPWSDIRSPVG